MIERGGVSDRALIGWIEGGEKKVVGEAAFGRVREQEDRVITGSRQDHVCTTAGLGQEYEWTRIGDRSTAGRR